MPGALRDVKHALRLMSTHQGFACSALVTITLSARHEATC